MLISEDKKAFKCRRLLVLEIPFLYPVGGFRAS